MGGEREGTVLGPPVAESESESSVERRGDGAGRHPGREGVLLEGHRTGGLGGSESAEGNGSDGGEGGDLGKVGGLARVGPIGSDASGGKGWTGTES